MAGKKFLGVPVRTPSKMVYSDLGRFALYIHSYVSSASYWFRLLEMETDRLPKKAYENAVVFRQKWKRLLGI